MVSQLSRRNLLENLNNLHHIAYKVADLRYKHTFQVMNLEIFLLQDVDLLKKCVTLNKHTQLETRKHTMKPPRRKIQKRNATISVNASIGLTMLRL